MLFIILLSFSIHAEDLYKQRHSPSYNREALQKTQELLRSREQRDAAIKGDKRAEDVDQKVGALAGSAKNKEKMYDISAQVLEKLVAETNGDSTKMQKILDEAQKNPQDFYNRLFDEKQKSQVRELSRDIEKNKPASNLGH